MSIDQVMRQIAAEFGGELRTIDGGLALRASLFDGTSTIVDVQQIGGSTFTPLFRARVHTTVVTDVPMDAPGLAALILQQNVYALSGAWEWHADGVFGLTASVLMHGDTLDDDAVLLRSLLQEHQRELQRCLPVISWWLGGGDEPVLEDVYSQLGDDTGGPFTAEELLSVLDEWTSVAGVDDRSWRPVEQSQGSVELEAAPLAGLPVPASRRRLRLDRVAHPFGGWGWRVLADLREPIGDDLGLLVGSGPLASARDMGTVLGAIVADPERDGHAVAHVFLRDGLLDTMGADGVRFVARVAIGAVHAATVVDATIVDFRSNGEGTSVDRLREASRHCFVRAAIGPAAVDVGPALLDFLAIDRLRVGTAPFEVADRGFRWRPTPAIQTVIADTPFEDNGHVITLLQLRSELGHVDSARRSMLLSRIANVNTFLPAMSLVIEQDDVVSLVSTWVTHEGTLHKRQHHLALIAALHATFGPVVMGHVVDFDVVDDLSLPTRGQDEQDDSIVQVGPDLADQVAHDEALAVTALRTFADRFGLEYLEHEDAAHVLALLRDGDEDTMVVGLVTIDPARDEYYGEGYAIHAALLGAVAEPDDERLNSLTLESHADSGSAIAVSWVRSPERGPGAHLTIPTSMFGGESGPGQVQRLVEGCLGVLGELGRALPGLVTTS